MITIISGTPGSGKTSLVVDMIMDEVRQGRKVFTHGIPKLLLGVYEAGDPHTWQTGEWLQIDRYDPTTAKLKGIKSTWMPRGCPTTCEFLATCPKIGVERPDAGSLVIIDEAHTEFPQRSSGSKPPPFIDAFTVHRHQGLDFWFLTQRPSFLDPFIRGLCSRHLHISLNAFSFSNSRNLYEWTEYQETVNRTSKLLASKRSYKPSPAVFPLYHSSTMHTKLEQRMPTILKTFIFVLILLLAIVAGVVYRANERYKSILHPQDLISTAQAGTLPLASSVPASDGNRGGQRSGPPVAADKPFTVPAPPANLSACIASASRCTCYTKNGVPVLMLENECRQAAHHPTERFDFSAPVSPSMPSFTPPSPTPREVGKIDNMPI